MTRLPSRSHQAYEAMRRAIVGADLAPGDVVSEVEWAGRLGMSRTPVREALNRLRQEGLVETVPHRGTFVHESSLDDLRDIFQLRKVLECVAAEEAVRRLTDAELEQTEARWQELAARLESGEAPDLETVGRLDNAFHTMIVNHSPNRRLRDIMQALNQEVLRYQLLTARMLGDVRSSIEQHLVLIHLLRQRDTPALVAALRDHIADAEHVVFRAR